MIEFVLDNLPQVILVAVGVLAAIAMFIASLFEGRSLKKSFREFKENIGMIIPKKNREDYQQTFSEFVKDYFLDEETGELVEKESPRNVQEEIDSYKDVALNVQLAKLLPDPDQKQGEFDEYYQARGDLDDIVRMNQTLAEIREAYGLSEDANMEDIRKYIDKVVSDLKKKIVSPDAKAQANYKEDKENGSQTSQKTEQES